MSANVGTVLSPQSDLEMNYLQLLAPAAAALINPNPLAG